MGPKVLQPVLLWVLLQLSLGVHAQELRDPTLPPSGIGTGPGAKPGAGLLGGEGMAVIVRDGKPFLVVGTRLYAPGQHVGPVRIERITETEVWLREDKALRKVPRFAGIQRSAVATSTACGQGVPKTSKTSKKTSKAVKTVRKPILSKTAKSVSKTSPGAKASAPSSNASTVASCDGAQP